MTTAQKTFAVLIAAGILIAGGLLLFGGSKPSYGVVNGVELHPLAGWFNNGLYAGSSQQFSVDASGNLTTTGTLTTATSVTTGNINSTSTTATSQTLVQGDLSGYSMLAITPNTGALTLTLPASSTLTSLIPNAGNRFSIDFYNATGTAAATITVSTGTGITLEKATTTAIASKHIGRLEFTRLPTSDIVAIYNTAI
jgi:hypothetical protein